VRNSKKVNLVSLTDEITDAIAKATGLPFKEVYEYLRRIRENDQFPKLPRAKELPTISDIALANLLIALLSGLPPQKAHVAVLRLADAEVFYDHFKSLERSKADLERLGTSFAAFLVPQHTFIEGVAALFNVARKGPSVFEETFRDTWISIDQRRFSGEINLQEVDHGTGRNRAFRFTVDYSPAESFFDGDLKILARVPASTIAALARAADTKDQ
jgi:hypothetical protein